MIFLDHHVGSNVIRRVLIRGRKVGIRKGTVMMKAEREKVYDNRSRQGHVKTEGNTVLRLLTLTREESHEPRSVSSL